MLQKIGRYEIRRELGRGGMATVYLAFDPRIRRQVAIKVLPRQFTHDPRYLARFEQEAQTLAALEHPAIVPIHDFGEHDDAPYLVMRYMSGGSLRERLDRRNGEPLSLEEIATALDRLAPALDLAHERNIIHRDLKPSNILFDDDGNPYLADFGIARLAEASKSMSGIIGTPAYMSPEQVEGKVKLDARSDIYTLGVMLYELLTGVTPYEAETATGQMYAHVHEPVPDVLQANPDLPPETREVIEKAMAKEREERYQTAAELAVAVHGLSSAEATSGADAAAGAALAAAAVEVAEKDPEPAVEDTLGEPEAAADEAPAEPPSGIEPLPDAALEDGAEKVLLYTAPEEAAENEQTAQPVVAAAAAGDSGAAPPIDAGGEKSGGLPGWIWWVGALALLLVVGLGIRAVLSGGDGEEPVAVPPIVTPTDDSSVPEVVEVTRVVTETITEEVEVTRVVEAETAVESEEEPTETPKPTETSTEEPSPTPAADPDLPPLNAALGDTWQRPADGMTMVYVLEGSFPMGSEDGNDDEAPAHDVSLDAFWIDRTEVTNVQYALCMNDGGCEPSLYADDSDYNGDDYPVVGVSWNDAEAYCEWADARLPTEAEWEYAARGPEGLNYPWGDGFDGEKANFCDVNCSYDWADESADDGYEFTAPAGSYPAGESWSGARDMSGNVWEWVNDWYDEAYYANSPVSNPQGPNSGDFKVLRGGSWGDDEDLLRGAYRYDVNPVTGYDNLGFRCVVSPGK